MALSKALKLSPISMVTALWKVSLLILVGPGLRHAQGDAEPRSASPGILISMSGVYLLNVQRAHIAWWAPLAVLFTDRGLRYTLLAALFFAPSVITIKWAMQLSDPYMGTLGGYLAASLLVTPIVLVTSQADTSPPCRATGWRSSRFGLFAALTTVTPGSRLPADAVVLRRGGEAGRDPLRARHRRPALRGEAEGARDRPRRRS